MQLRCGRMYYLCFVAKFHSLSSSKKLWKSVKIWVTADYKAVLLFSDTVYTSCLCIDASRQVSQSRASRNDAISPQHSRHLQQQLQQQQSHQPNIYYHQHHHQQQMYIDDSMTDKVWCDVSVAFLRIHAQWRRETRARQVKWPGWKASALAADLASALAVFFSFKRNICV